MAICTKGIGVVKKLLNDITPELEVVIDEVTTVTGKIKALEANPDIEAVVAIIPGGSTVESWLNKGIDELTGVLSTGETVAQKIVTWFNTLTTPAQVSGGVLKLASLSIKAGDPAPAPTKTESFYDSAVQLHIMSNKPA